MTDKQKCEKLASVLETVATKLRDPKIGIKIWETEEPTLQTLVAQISVILKRATDISNDALPRSLQKRGRTAKTKKAETEEENWPDILLD